ncbi:MAG: Cysteine desulfurase [Planctomycetota bacterium]|jgi:cysteine desulfurase
MIYLDHHATTPLDPDVLEAMLPLLREHFANPGSISHQAGRDVAEMVGKATEAVCKSIGADSDEILFTSGATESTNLAIFGICLHPRQTRREIVSVVSEHRATLDPLARLEKSGWEIKRAPIAPQSTATVSSLQPGSIDLDYLRAAIGPQTALVTVMLANNEIGTIAPVRQIAELCHRYQVPLHCDAAQAVGRIAVNVNELDVDLLSFSAHKLYGPKGVGALYVRRRPRSVRLYAQIVGGGQQHNLRSGTLNAPGIIGLATALTLADQRRDHDQQHTMQLRNRLWLNLQQEIPNIELNGSSLDSPMTRLAGNLNCSFPGVEGQSLMLAMPELCVSSGSACTSADPHPSHVLLALGLSEDRVRSSLRFGIGRFNTQAEIDLAVQLISTAYRKLKSLG